MSEKIMKIKNSVKVICWLNLISYYTDCYQADCSYCYVHHMFTAGSVTK